MTFEEYRNELALIEEQKLNYLRQMNIIALQAEQDAYQSKFRAFEDGLKAMHDLDRRQQDEQRRSRLLRHRIMCDDKGCKKY